MFGKIKDFIKYEVGIISFEDLILVIVGLFILATVLQGLFKFVEWAWS